MTQFYYEFDWDGRELLLQSRAIDETGYVQPTKAELRKVRGVNSIYHNNGIQTWHAHRAERWRMWRFPSLVALAALAGVATAALGYAQSSSKAKPASSSAAAVQPATKMGIGRTPTPEEIAGGIWIFVLTESACLSGRGALRMGRPCTGTLSSCHGESGERRTVADPLWRCRHAGGT